MHEETDRRLRQVMRNIDAGRGGGFEFAAWLSNSGSMEAAKYFLIGIRNDCVTLFHAPKGRSIRAECRVVGYSIASVGSKRYAEIAESLEQDMGEKMICPLWRDGKCRTDACLHVGKHDEITGTKDDDCRKPPRNHDCLCCVEVNA